MGVFLHICLSKYIAQGHHPKIYSVSSPAGVSELYFFSTINQSFIGEFFG
jgi:hypothetical protein